MAASLLVEEESGSYTGRIRHSHNGYFAGDLSQASRSRSELRVSYVPGRLMPCAEDQYGALALTGSVAVPDRPLPPR